MRTTISTLGLLVSQLGTATIAAAVITMTACSSAPRETSRGQGSAQNTQTPGILWNRPHKGPNAVKPFAAAGAQLTYMGGPVISNIKAYTVAWGPNVIDQSTMNDFFNTIPNSPYLDWLSEYNTPSQSIGRGSFGGAFVDSNAPGGSVINDSQIQAELSSLIDSGAVPAPDANSYYQILFPPGVNVVGADGTQFCVQTPNGTPCAYHSTFVKNGVNVYYSPQPDYSGTCGDLCGFVPGNHTASLTTASSHEMVEAITDAAVGIGNLAWYDNNNGEIGDICEVESQGQQVDGIFVQTEWSNQANKCQVTSGTCTPQCGGKQCGSDSCGGSCGSCPAGQSCDANGQCNATCTPQCGGKQCGSDNCGGSCGSCATGQTCDANGQCQGGTGGCAHPICSTGVALTSTCDPCAGQVCGQDPFCCSTQWDNICVGEVGSICGQGCP